MNNQLPRSPTFTILSQSIPVHIFTKSFFYLKTYFNKSSSSDFEISKRFPTKSPYSFLVLPPELHVQPTAISITETTRSDNLQCILQSAGTVPSKNKRHYPSACYMFMLYLAPNYCTGWEGGTPRAVHCQDYRALYIPHRTHVSLWGYFRVHGKQKFKFR